MASTTVRSGKEIFNYPERDCLVVSSYVAARAR
jgi:hypothetical protein